MERVSFKVKDMSLSVWGGTETKLAEAEIPGILTLREEFGVSKPLAGARLSGCLRMTIQARTLQILKPK